MNKFPPETRAAISTAFGFGVLGREITNQQLVKHRSALWCHFQAMWQIWKMLQIRRYFRPRLLVNKIACWCISSNAIINPMPWLPLGSLFYWGVETHPASFPRHGNWDQRSILWPICDVSSARVAVFLSLTPAWMQRVSCHLFGISVMHVLHWRPIIDVLRV